ncbi:hypothetical protein KR044_002479 [Drosophila immigrans]|nr:hypothetical protein KR044_002479 [Drosophila immigrans]
MKIKIKSNDPGCINSCKHIMRIFLSQKYRNLTWIFKEPIEAEHLGLYDYHETVKHPMDLGTIARRLNANYYTNAFHFVSDMRSIFYNTYLYTTPDHLCYEMAEKLQRIFENLIGKYLPHCRPKSAKIESNAHNNSNHSNFNFNSNFDNYNAAKNDDDDADHNNIDKEGESNGDTADESESNNKDDYVDEEGDNDQDNENGEDDINQEKDTCNDNIFKYGNNRNDNKKRFENITAYEDLSQYWGKNGFQNNNEYSINNNYVDNVGNPYGNNFDKNNQNDGGEAQNYVQGNKYFANEQNNNYIHYTDGVASNKDDYEVPMTPEEDMDFQVRLQQLEGVMLLHVVHIIFKMEELQFQEPVTEIEFDVRSLKIETKRSIIAYMEGKRMTGNHAFRAKKPYSV